MVYLVEVNGSSLSQDALRAAAARARREPNAVLVLLHVSPSARPAEMESARRLLKESRDCCRTLVGDLPVSTCLEVGNRLDRLSQAAERLDAECVVVVSHDAGEFPRLREVGESARVAVERMTRPVMVVGRDGARRFEVRTEGFGGSRG